jgi:hypothetical protein
MRLGQAVVALVLTLTVQLGLAEDKDSASVEEPSVASKYLSDIPGSGYAWLAEQQKLAYGPQSRAPLTAKQLKARLMSEMPERKLWQDAVRAIESEGIDKVIMPTPYEDFASYFVTNWLSELIWKAASSQAGNAIQKIQWGTLPIPEVNASAQRIGGDYVVVLNRHLFPFLYGLVLIVDRTVSIRVAGDHAEMSYDDEAFAKAIARAPWLVTQFAGHIAAFANSKGWPGLTYADNIEQYLVITQVLSAERFVIGHEFGHIVAGDADQGTRLLNLPKMNGGTFQLLGVGRDWNQELRADVAGQKLALDTRSITGDSSQSNETALLAAFEAYAPALFLELADSLEDAILCAGSGEGSGRALAGDVQEHFVSIVRTHLDSGRAITLLDADAAILGCRESSHPPAWLRRILAEKRADGNFMRPPFVRRRQWPRQKPWSRTPEFWRSLQLQK